MATDIFESVLDKTSTLLKADSTVTGLLSEGADGVKEWFGEETDSVNALPQPYINLMPVTQGDHVEQSSRHSFQIDIAVEYCMGLQSHGDRFQIFKDKAKLDVVMFGSALESFVTADNEKVWRENIEVSFVIENGLRKIRYEITFHYVRNK